MKFRTGDKILVTAGKDKGRQGKITKILPARRRAIVEGINLYKRHLKPRGQGQTGQIVSRERPIPAANIAIICPKCKQATRVGYKLAQEGQKTRICRKCREEIG